VFLPKAVVRAVFFDVWNLGKVCADIFSVNISRVFSVVLPICLMVDYVVEI
jgi:hypothetical protein